jgi:predicted nucleic acid-binding Zn ribbon protein
MGGWKLVLKDYICNKCCTIIELIENKEELKCSKCSSSDLQEIHTFSTTFILKGTCWARDGYK